MQQGEKRKRSKKKDSPSPVYLLSYKGNEKKSEKERKRTVYSVK